MEKVGLVLIIVCLLTSANVTIADTFTMTFEEPPVSFQTGYGQGVPYIEGDYFVSTRKIPGHSGSIIRFNPFQNSPVPNNGTIHMGATYQSDPFLQRVDGCLFSLISLDVGEYSKYFSTSSLPIIGYRSDGTTISRTLPIDGKFDGYGGIDDFQHYTLNWTNIVRVEFLADGFSMDNIVLIPEPATLLLLGLGGLMLRRKK